MSFYEGSNLQEAQNNSYPKSQNLDNGVQNMYNMQNYPKQQESVAQNQNVGNFHGNNDSDDSDDDDEDEEFDNGYNFLIKYYVKT